MAPGTSPLPGWSAITEPPPSDSDEDMVPNDSALYSSQRKRKNKSQPASQPKSKRPKTIENSDTSSKRTTDEAATHRRPSSSSLRSVASTSDAGPSRPSSGSKVKTSRPSLSQSARKAAEPASTARTKPVRRTRDEKRRQRSGLSSDESSDELASAPTLPSRKQSASFPSASAPPARNGAFDRDKMRQRFQSGESSKASSSHRPKSAPVKKKINVDSVVIDLSSTPEPDIPKPTYNLEKVIELPSSDSEAERIRKISAARKTQKRRATPPNPQDIVEIIDSDDELPMPVERNEKPTYEMSLNDPDHNGMNLGEGLSSPAQSRPSGPGLSEMRPKTSLPAPETFQVANGTSRADEASQSLEQGPSGPASAKPTIATADAAIHSLQSRAIHNGPVGEPPRNDPASGGSAVSSRPSGTSDFDEDVGLQAQASVGSDAPQSTIPVAGKLHRAESSSANPRPDLVSQNPNTQGPAQAPLSARAPKPLSKPIPLPLPRPRLPISAQDTPLPSTSSSHPIPSAFPAKNISDSACGPSAAALQQTLSTRPLPLPKRWLPFQETPLPSKPAPVTPEQSMPSSERMPTAPLPLPPRVKKPQSATTDGHPNSLVEAINATGQHNAKSMSVSSDSLPLPLSPALPSPPQTTPTPPASMTPAPLLQPPRQEQAPAALTPSLVNEIIDLTLSDDEQEADPPRSKRKHPRFLLHQPRELSASIGSVQSLLGSVHSLLGIRQNPQVGRKRIGNLMRVASATAAGMASNSQSPAPSATLDLTPLSGVDASDTAVDTSQTAVPRNDIESPPADKADDRRSQVPVHDDGTADMAVDTGAPPLPLESPCVPEPLDVPIVAESSESIEQEAVSMASESPLEDPMLDADHRPPAAPTYERRSYDDVEVYDLEYIGPPEPTGPAINPEEGAVEQAVPLVPVTVDPPVQKDMDVLSPAPNDDDSSSADTPERDFLEASDNESSAIPASPKPLRRSSRRSSSSSSTDPLDFINKDYDHAVDSRAASPDSLLNDSLRGSPVSDTDDSFFDSADINTSFEATTATQYPIMTWESYRQDLNNFRPRVYYARDLVSELHDYIHSFGESFRMSPHMRHVLESFIRENTADDEPDAPWIDIINEVDAEPTPPWEFYYTNKLWVGEGIDPPDMTKLVGCDCKGRCDPNSKTCSCLLKQKEYSAGYFSDGFAYDNKGRLKRDGIPIFECNSLCACDDDECKNRVVQHGRKCHVAIKKTAEKGWGVFAAKKIPKGTFIGIYSGEFLREEVGERRGLVYDRSGRTYLLDVDWYYLKDLKEDKEDNQEGSNGEYVVDAYHAGNFTRFLNHSCDPNCKVTPCYIDEPDLMKSLITLFASRDIAAGEELCFAYSGDPDNLDEEDLKAKGSIKNKCFCKAANCKGFMF
ncbi:Histone-lysine N-methyltransferase, H3 lysine-9 specific [Mycena sanguinolenta]|uniref:Histone-lysine N-methyltransferase, H3 lysine-9 specific n=1 Tax=Mycena sanguinolenta TaxID=230812 RepID=A0A8H6ZHU2_9AGAR|nr:Histone-lysine N-methyltransferase, H3 lysine-9 specific [Mycena sanguinolenta]